MFGKQQQKNLCSSTSLSSSLPLAAVRPGRMRLIRCRGTVDKSASVFFFFSLFFFAFLSHNLMGSLKAYHLGLLYPLHVPTRPLALHGQTHTFPIRETVNYKTFVNYSSLQLHKQPSLYNHSAKLVKEKLNIN